MSIENNRDQLIESIQSILDKHKDKNLTIIGYSAGGVIVILAMDQLADGPLAKRIQFNTIAAPLFGYRSPSISWLGSPFVGKTTIQLGIGNYDKLVHKQMPQCNHWVTTRCEMDQHSCENDGLSPQVGLHGLPSSLPCGEDHIYRVDNECHASVLNYAFNKIIK
ncbi:MAG: PE-PPE domain-containing protein [Bacteriovorax sp.]|nr:PE-PPE domain-containing protein [Bacteriovorax sp.]